MIAVGAVGHTRAAWRPHTVHGYCRTLRTFAGWLADYTDLPANPLAKFRPGRLPKKEVPPLSEDEHRRVIESLDPRTSTGLRNLAVVSMLLDTGLRASELCNLRLDDLNLATGEIRVLSGKGAKDRVVALGRRSREVVRRYVHVFRKTGEFDAGPRAPVFLSYRGRPLAREGWPASSLRLASARASARSILTGFATRLGSPTCAPAAMC